jgi:hypothetical protein
VLARNREGFTVGPLHSVSFKGGTFMETQDLTLDQKFATVLAAMTHNEADDEKERKVGGGSDTGHRRPSN